MTAAHCVSIFLQTSGPHYFIFVENRKVLATNVINSVLSLVYYAIIYISVIISECNSNTN